MLAPAAPPEGDRGITVAGGRRQARARWGRPPSGSPARQVTSKAGTAEFLLAPDGEFWFLELNTRLQVEHPVTEMVTGRDLVADQLRIAAGEPLGFTQRDVTSSGHAVERDATRGPVADFVPATGNISGRWPSGSGEGIHIDVALPRATSSASATTRCWPSSRVLGRTEPARSPGSARCCCRPVFLA